MKCKLCDCETTWIESIGYDNFIVCNKCYEKLEKKISDSKATRLTALQIIMLLGSINKEDN